MRDPSWVEKYAACVPALVEKHDGRYLAQGGAMEVLEGETPLPSLVVVLEFPSMEKARAFYGDPEYVPFIKLRQQGSDLDMVLVDGV
jgi:uncharacterized protein (DUF1330 family)